MKQQERLHTREVTTEMRVIDGKTGKPRLLWNETAIGRYLREKFGVTLRVFLLGFYAPVLRTHNLITNVGHAAANGRMSNQGSYSPFVNIAIGIGTTAAAATDRALSQEITSAGGARGAATATQVTTTVSNDTTQLAKTFTFTSGTFAITEEGIVDTSSSATVTTTTQSRTSGDTTVTVASGAGITNGDYLQWEAEIIQVTAGGGTGTLTFTRGQLGTSAASHGNGTALVDINTSGNLLAKQTFAAVNVNGANGDQFSVTHKYST